MNKKIKIISIFVGLLVIFGFFRTVQAQGFMTDAFNQLGHAGGVGGAGYADPKDPRLIIAEMIRLLLSLAGTVLFVLMAYAGYQWMTAQGNDEQIANAKKTITNSTIGLVVILSAYGITILVTNLAQGRNLGNNASQGTTLDSAVGNWFR